MLTHLTDLVTTGNYGLWVLGDHWRISGLTVAHASKGIVLDGSVYTTIDDVEVHTIGDEAIHARSDSHHFTLRNSSIHGTGLRAPRYGEGVYVGSAHSNWDTTQTHPVSGREFSYGGSDGMDRSDHALIEGNVIRDTNAEGADLKEGSSFGIIRNNRFIHSGVSGENSADSAVDVKGNAWLVEANVVRDTARPWREEGERSRPSAFRDGFQTHDVHEGWGRDNVFRANVVVGAVPGFALNVYVDLGNVVHCDNTYAARPARLVGDNNRKSTCVLAGTRASPH